MKICKIIAVTVMMMVSAVLGGCTTTAEITVKENVNADQAIAITEEYLKGMDPSYKVVKSSFSDVEAELRKGSSEKALTDWVSGEYEGKNKERVLVNVKSGEMYTSENWDEFSDYCFRLADDLKLSDYADVKIAVTATTDVPYFADNDQYGMMTVTNMLPAGTGADDGSLKAFLSDGSYQIKYIIRISDEVDINEFKEIDPGVFGSSVSLHVEQYSRVDFINMASGDNLGQPLEIYDSGM